MFNAVRSYLRNRLKGYMAVNNMTMEKCFRKLEDIRMIRFRNSPARLVKAVTKTQRELLNALGLDEDELLRRVNSSGN